MLTTLSYRGHSRRMMMGSLEKSKEEIKRRKREQTKGL
jgi:hypothetical protein